MDVCLLMSASRAITKANNLCDNGHILLCCKRTENTDTLLTLRKGNLIFPLTSSRSTNVLKAGSFLTFLTGSFFSPHNGRHRDCRNAVEDSEALRRVVGRAPVAQSRRRRGKLS